jgi:hypothetical protein
MSKYNSLSGLCLTHTTLPAFSRFLAALEFSYLEQGLGGPKWAECDHLSVFEAKYC